MNGWNPTALPLISCTARAMPSKRTWKPSLAEARPRWATQRAFATRCRRAWFQTLQDRLKSTPYPDQLVEGVIKMNLPVLGGTAESASITAAAWLASYFDLLFAANRRFNPGEKRLLAHAQALPTTPERMAADVEAACTGSCSLESCVADHLEAMRTRLEHYLQAQGLLSQQVIS
jgi:hypothetical protein